MRLGPAGLFADPQGFPDLGIAGQPLGQVLQPPQADPRTAPQLGPKVDLISGLEVSLQRFKLDLEQLPQADQFFALSIP